MGSANRLYRLGVVQEYTDGIDELLREFFSGLCEVASKKVAFEVLPEPFD